MNDCLFLSVCYSTPMKQFLFKQLCQYDFLDILLNVPIGSSRPPSPASFSLEGRKPAEVGG